MKVDLRSDTLTKPTPGMLKFMMAAEVGDDVFGEDPTVIALEERVAAMFGHEAALFCASGTMSNQVALKAQTQPMDEIIAHEICHIYYYETGGYAFNSGVSIKLGKGNAGIMSADEVERNIQPDYDWLPRTSLVTIENTCNKGGGSCYSLDEIRKISELCRSRELKLHMDGARVFNAMTARGYSATALGGLCDTIAMSFCKGMGAPVGSVLVGPADTIRKARRVRKAFGGGMRQAGILAAACIYALDHHLDRLAQDHANAAVLGSVLSGQSWVECVHPVETNIILFDVADEIAPEDVLAAYRREGIEMMVFGPRTLRAITHMDIGAEHIHHVQEITRALKL
jgi:threonine aldolase